MAPNLFVKITPKPENFVDARQAICSILEVTRKEPGCVQFILLQGKKAKAEDQQPKCLYLYEEWTSREALESHHKEPYTAEIFEKYKAWLAMPIEITDLERLEA